MNSLKQEGIKVEKFKTVRVRILDANKKTDGIEMLSEFCDMVSGQIVKGHLYEDGQVWIDTGANDSKNPNQTICLNKGEFEVIK